MQLLGHARSTEFFNGKPVLIRNANGEPEEFTPDKGWYDARYSTSDRTFWFIAGPFATQEDAYAVEIERAKELEKRDHVRFHELFGDSAPHASPIEYSDITLAHGLLGHTLGDCWFCTGPS